MINNTNGLLDLNINNLWQIRRFLLSLKDKTAATLDIVREIDDVNDCSENQIKLDYIMDSVRQQFQVFSEIRDFLEECERTALSEENQRLVDECQELLSSIETNANSIRMRIHKVQENITILAKPQPKKADYYQVITSDKNYIVTAAMLDHYQQIRDILKDLHKELLFFDSDLQRMMDTIGRRLDVKDGNQLFLETEHEMNVFIDVSLFQYYKEGKTIIERYYQQNKDRYIGETLQILLALKNARFCLLDIIKPAEEGGLVIYDRLRQEELLLVDKGLSDVAKKVEQYVILTHYIKLPEFALTTGASTPVLVSNASGKTMLKIFEKLVAHHQNEQKLNHKDYLQAITDLYKTAIHEDVTKTVSSKLLPFGRREAFNTTIH